MEVILIIILAGLTGFFVCFLSKRVLVSWLLSCLVVPVFALLFEFVLSYSGGGASMWNIAIVVGGVLGAVFGFFGVWLGQVANERKRKGS